MQRRSIAQSGWVAFPVSDPAWKNSGEGGMLVKLVVCDNREFDAQFGECCGVSVTDVLQESFVGDDQRPKPVSRDGCDSLEDLQAEQVARAAWQAYHFPHANDSGGGVEQFLSRSYLASLVLGSTGWSGWHEGEERYWECRFDDLTVEGKALYEQLKALYPGCDVHLLTFLDT